MAQWHKPFDMVISIWTWFRNIGTIHTSHVEKGFRLGSNWMYYSSTLRGKARGARWISEKDLFKHPERWVVKEYEVDDQKFIDMVHYANKFEGMDYDLLGVFGYGILVGNIQDPDKVYCSEVCNYLDFESWQKESPRSYSRKMERSFEQEEINIEEELKARK